MTKSTKRNIIYILPIPVLVLSLFVGPSDVVNQNTLVYFIKSFNSSYYQNSKNNDMIKTVLLDIRLPRLLLTFITGGALSMSGNSIQAIFRNPLTDPYIMGLSSGAAFGASLALAFFPVSTQIAAFIFGLTSIFLSYAIALKKNSISTVSLILSGIIVSGIFTALLTTVQFFTDPFRLQSIIHWTMGNLQNADWQKLKSVLIPVSIGFIIMVLYSWRMNVLALGDDEAQSSGLNPKVNKFIILIGATLASSAVVSVAGVIGMFGLIVPHAVRMMAGTDNRQNMPLNFLFGGTTLLIIDDFSRSMTSFEIPIGVFTMLLGAPFFIYLMKKSNIGWSE